MYTYFNDGLHWVYFAFGNKGVFYVYIDHKNVLYYNFRISTGNMLWECMYDIFFIWSSQKIIYAILVIMKTFMCMGFFCLSSCNTQKTDSYFFFYFFLLKIKSRRGHVHILYYSFVLNWKGKINIIFLKIFNLKKLFSK